VGRDPLDGTPAALVAFPARNECAVIRSAASPAAAARALTAPAQAMQTTSSRDLGL
jgi:hypothetical protein